MVSTRIGNVIEQYNKLSDIIGSGIYEDEEETEGQPGVFRGGLIMWEGRKEGRMEEVSSLL